MPSEAIVTIYPSNRTAWGVNTPGSTYNYTIYITDPKSNRTSHTIYITVRITPNEDSNSCVRIISSY